MFASTGAYDLDGDNKISRREYVEGYDSASIVNPRIPLPGFLQGFLLTVYYLDVIFRHLIAAQISQGEQDTTPHEVFEAG